MPYYELNEGRLYYESAGEGPLLVIYPGNTSGVVHHAGELAYFSDRFRVVAFDYLGYGRSSRQDRFPDDFYVRNAHHGVQLARHLGYDRMVIIGTSGGGITALETAIMFPEMIVAAIVDSTPAEYPVERMKRLLKGREEYAAPAVAFYQAAHGEDWRSVVEADSDMILRVAHRRGHDLYQSRLGEVSCPVLITASYADDSIGEPGVPLVRLVAQIAKARGVLFHEGAHPSMWSQAIQFRREVDRFMDDVRADDAKCYGSE